MYCWDPNCKGTSTSRMTSGHNHREHSLLEVLTAKHYPQVFRVTRPYHTNLRECLKKGQLITVLDRRKVNLVVGVDSECREFYVRKDRSTNVEVVEDARIAYNLSVIIPLAKHIEGIEFRKEVRFEKQIFEVGEIFTIEKVNKSFRGRCKSLALRRRKDNKVYRLPLDMIGMFKLITGKSVLPLSKILSLRVPPITVQFRNTPTSSNYPRGKVTLREIIAVDIIYILSVRSEVYTYEAFLADPNIFVERCPLTIPKPILEIIPNGMLVNSPEYIHPIKGNYRQKISEIESKLCEDIYAITYYGSATIDKPADDDTHLINRNRLSSGALSGDEKSDTTSVSSFPSNAPSTPDSEQGVAPLPLPRYSKKPRQRIPQSFPAILESDQSQCVKKATSSSSNIDISKKTSIDELKTAINKINVNDVYLRKNFKSSDSLDNRSSHNRSPNNRSPHNRSPHNSGPIKHSARSSSCTNITSMNWHGSSDSPKVFYKPPINNSNNDQMIGRQSPGPLSSDCHSPGIYNNHSQTNDSNEQQPHLQQLYRNQSPLHQSSPRVYDAPNVNKGHVHSRSSSIATEDSGDSGVILNFGNTRYSPNGSRLSSPSTEDNPLYATLTKHQVENFHPPPLPARDALYQNIHHLQVDIDIGDNADVIVGDIDETYSDVAEIREQTHLAESPYVNFDKTHMRTGSFPDRSFSTQSLFHSPSLTSVDMRSRQLDEIQCLSQTDVGKLLQKLKLDEFVESFARELINGRLLKELDESTLVNDLHMSHVQARKIVSYVNGWRPILQDFTDKDLERVPPVFWSINNVFVELQKINLTKFALFCKTNLIDGPLLKDLVENNYISTLKNDHNISLSGIEVSRLKAFVLKEWRPDKEMEQYTTDLDKFDKKNQSNKKYKQLWTRLTVSSN